MSFLDRVNQRHQKLTNPVSGDLSPLSETRYGHDPFRFIHSEGSSFLDRAATSDDVYAVINLRARLMSGLKLKVYRGTGSSRSEVTNGSAYELLKHVNPFWTPRRLYRMDELSLCLWGQSFWAIEKDQFGTPREIWWLKPSRVRVVPDAKGYIRGYIYEPANGGPPIAFLPDEIIWFRYPNPLDEFSPLSPLVAAQRAAETGSAMLDSNRNLFDKGLQIGGFVVPSSDVKTFTKEQADDLETFLDNRFRGAKNAHKWAVMRFEAQFKAAEVSPKDAEFAQGMNLTLRRVCNVYGVPSPLLNDLEFSTLANLRELHQFLWADTLVPDAELRQEEITEQLLPMFSGRPLHAEFDFSSVSALQESTTSVWDRERQQIEVGSLRINEWREKYGLPPVPWGNAWWAPVNKSAVNGATATPQATTPTEEVQTDQAEEMMSMLDLQTLEFRHGRFALNGHSMNGRRRKGNE